MICFISALAQHVIVMENTMCVTIALRELQANTVKGNVKKKPEHGNCDTQQYKKVAKIMHTALGQT